MAAEYLPVLPLILLVAGGLVILLLEPFTAPARKSRMGQIAVLSTFTAAYSLSFFWNAPERELFHGMLAVDRFGIFFQWLFLVITGICALISLRFNERENMNRGEYYALLLFACSGMVLMAASADLILTFLGIEILSIATYILAGFKRADLRSNESALKYFILGSFATAFLLYGIALLYGSTGSTNYRAIQEALAARLSMPGPALAGLGLLLVGFGFKLATVPFHAWAPDVYEGAPSPVTAFMLVGPKAAGFAALIRVLIQAVPILANDWRSVLWLVAILTMTLGNTVAVRQTNIKRMLAYSAIAQAGYLLVGIVAHNPAGQAAVAFYLMVYTLMNLGAMSVVLSLSRQGDARVHLEDYAGLARSAPVPAAALSLFLISLAGIPLTGGFIGKFYLFGAALSEGFIGLVVIAVLNSVLSVYYYFRVMVYMYMREPADTQEPPATIPAPVMAVILIAAAGILVLGVFPGPAMNLAAGSALALK
jgi:NADH-quinone oxidoreductase subunit N